jgi:PKD repeat protein
MLPRAYLLALVLAVPQGVRAHPAAAVGDPLPRVQCPPGYTARIYAQGLRSPDGLAISPAGILHVVDEIAGSVSQVDGAGNLTPVLTGLNSPEGLTFDPATGALYVVEDVENGRLIERSADGTVTTLARGLDAPEGVTWADGTLYLTESNLQFADVPELRTRVTAFSPPATLTRVITDTPELDGTLVHIRSFSGIATGPDGQLYVANELSGQEGTVQVVLVPGTPPTTITVTSTESILIVDPAAGTRELFVEGLTAPEGLRFSAGGAFPLYVAEEDLSDGQGWISVVDALGVHAPLCTGFLTVEDVVVDESGTLYVSEDESGSVIAIEGPPPAAPEARFDAAPRSGIAPLAVVFTNTSSGSYQTRLWDLGDGQTSILEDPIHTYRAPGSYTVTLTVVGPAGSDSHTEADYVAVYRGQYLPLVLQPMEESR